MQSEIQTILRCGVIGGFGAFCCYIVGLAPLDVRFQQALRAGFVAITIIAMLRIAGLL